jgi:hypothetical protein
MTDDLKERFRTLDSLEFPYRERPPETGRSGMTTRIARRRRAGAILFALAIGVFAIGFAIRAFGEGPDRPTPPADSEGETPTGPGSCDYGPWIKHCPEAGWARSVVSAAGLEIVDEQTVLVVGTSKGGDFYFWAMDPSLHGQVTPFEQAVGGGNALVLDHVDGVPIYGFGSNRRLWLWSHHGLNIFVDGRAPLAAPSRQDIVALVRASGSVPYTSATPAPGVAIPDIVGLSDQQGMLALNDLGLTWVVGYRTVGGAVDRWHVASVDPPAGTRVVRGSSVRVLVATEVTRLPGGAADALDCDIEHRELFGGPQTRITPGGSAYIVGNLPGIELGVDEVVQVTFESGEWKGLWHVIRDGSVVAVVDFDSLDGEACQGSGVAGT